MMFLFNRNWRLVGLMSLFILTSRENNELVSAFSPNAVGGLKSMTTTSTYKRNTNISLQSNDQNMIDFETSYVLSKEEVKPLVVMKKGEKKEKWINLYGFRVLFACFATLPTWWLAMEITDRVCKANPELDPNRSFYDKTGKMWSKIFLSILDCYPTISGDLDRLKDTKTNEGQGCLFVGNHASWLDIPMLCTVLDPVFKFIAKGELKSFPCIGKQLTGGNHVMIDRDDRRSQLRTFKEGVTWLKNGVPLMAFPEGRRSEDGRLMDFKGGIFSMAVKANVPIVPISISNTHAIMPSNALLPVQPGAGKLHVHVHPPIPVEGKTDTELADLVREALLSKLPLDQQPLPKESAQDLREEKVVTKRVSLEGVDKHAKASLKELGKHATGIVITEHAEHNLHIDKPLKKLENKTSDRGRNNLEEIQQTK
mmetsp:Transcript_26833/g.31215  ORF Transcript_26833/g.31215 Transcript_26833/m.31215 type:complete len:425 (-) Transcript_26833:71-1345(-)